MRSLKSNTILNAVQSVCKILFPLITIPYASRVLEATNYGKVSFGNSIIRYFLLFSALGISTYSQREAPAFRDDKRRIGDFANQMFTIRMIASFISYAVLLILLTVSYKLQDYKMLILIQSSAILLETLGADWVNVVYEDYFFITVRYIAMQVVALVMLFLFVRTPADYYMFAVINVIATAGGNLFNIFYIRKYVRLRIVHPRECLKHMKAILMLFSVSITTFIYISSDITILGWLTTDADVGIYTIAANVYSVVKQVISAVIIACIPRLAYYLGKEMKQDYRVLAQKVLDSLISLLLPAIAGLAFLSYHVLNVMGGEEYVAGQPALIVLAFALLFAIMAGFYANGYLLLAKKDKTYLVATTLSALVNIALNFVLIPKIGIVGAAITTLIAEMIIAFIAGRAAIREYHLVVDKRILISSVLGALLISGICILTNHLPLSSIPILGIAFLVGVTSYYFVLKVTKNPLGKVINIFFLSRINRAFGRNHMTTTTDQRIERREGNYDLLRILASIAVVFIHANWLYFEQIFDSDRTIIWKIESIINILTRYSVPAFVMLSGAFILKNNKLENIKEFYKQSTRKIFGPALIVIIILAGLKLIENIILKKSIISEVQGILLGSTYGLWYMHMLLGLYFLAPFIYRIKVHVSSGAYILFAIVLMIWAAVSQAMNQPRMAGSMAVVFPFLAYFIMGDVIYSKLPTIRGKGRAFICCIVSVMCIAATFVFRLKIGSQQYISNAYTCFFSPTIIVYSISVFVFFGLIRVNLNLKSLAEKSFYAYLFHYPILIMTNRYISNIKSNDLIKIFMLGIVTTIVSYIVAYCFDWIYKYTISKCFDLVFFRVKSIHKAEKDR